MRLLYIIIKKMATGAAFYNLSVSNNLTASNLTLNSPLISSSSANFSSLTTTSATIQNLNTNSANISTLTSNNNISFTNASGTSLYADNISGQNADISTANISELNVPTLHTSNFSFTGATGENLHISNTANIKNLPICGPQSATNQSIAIGQNAGQNLQGSSAVAIGYCRYHGKCHFSEKTGKLSRNQNNFQTTLENEIKLDFNISLH